MKALFLIAKNNIKKRKTDAVILVILIAIATMFLYVSVSVLSSYGKVIDDRNAEVNGADYMFFTGAKAYSEIFDLIEAKKGVIDSEREDALHTVSMKYFKPGDNVEDAGEINVLFERKEFDRKISCFNEIGRNGEWRENSIILPYYMHVAEGYNAGDEIIFKKDDKEFRFVIYAFAEDVSFSTPLNINVIRTAVSDKFFYENEKNMDGVLHATKVKCDNLDTENFEKEVENMLAGLEGDQYASEVTITLNYDVMKRGTSTMLQLFMAMLTVFSVLLIVVVLFIIKFNISNSIDENIKNTGIMEACGYTTAQMMAATILQFLILGVTGNVVGFGISNAASNSVGKIISSAMGLLWDEKFNFASAVFGILIINLFILIVAWLSARKFKKISPLDALRNGIYSHNFKKNRLKLESSRLSLNASLGIKSTLFSLKKNVVICAVVVILAFVTNAAIVIFTNFMKTEVLLQICGIEYADILVTSNSLDVPVNDIKSELEADDRIEKIIGESGVSVTLVDNETGEDGESMFFMAYDEVKKANIPYVVSGRLPEYDNEVMLSSFLCKKYDYKIGDTVEVRLGNTTKDYILVGACQGMTRLGKCCIITMEGIKRLNQKIEVSQLYINVKEGEKIDEVIKDFKAKYGEEYVVSDYNKSLDSAIGSIKMALNALCIALILVSAVVIALILILLIKSHITREKKNMGIYKAIGYKTSEIVVQIMVSYLPVVLIGGVIGSVLTSLLFEKIFILCFSTFDIKRIDISISVLCYVGSVVGLLLWSELVALISSLKTRKIMPYKMITEQ